MGTLSYGPWSVEFEDRLLTHLQIVIVNKFRRGESFLMSWIDAVAVGDGRSSIWLAPDMPIYFRFSGSRVPAIDDEWLRRLSGSASTSTGLIVTDEHGKAFRAGNAGAVQHLPRPAVARLPQH